MYFLISGYMCILKFMLFSCVICIFFSCSSFHKEHTVQAGHQLARPFALDAYDHAVGRHEIFDGRAFLQEFGVRGHVERHLAAAFVYLFPDHGLDLLRRTDGYGAFGDEHRILLDVATERTGDFEHVFQVCRTVFVGRCADGREDYFHLVQAVRQFGREVQAPLLDIALNKFLSILKV